MSRKTKIILFMIFAILLILAYFFIFRQKASAPQKISIQNTAEESDIEIKQPENLPDNISPKEEKDPKPENTTKPIEPKTSTPEIIPAEKAAGQNSDLKIIKKLVSWGLSSASNRKIDSIIIHSSYNALGGDKYSVDKLIAEYKEYGVAPHYLIDREGKIYRLVEDKNIAYHAGESKMPDGRNGVNNFSLGIEVMNTQDDSYTSAQYAALNSLLSNLKSRYLIKYVLGHDDIAPGRKTDPWNFDWGKIK